MGAHVADLLIQLRRGDLAFLDVHHQAIVRANKAYVQPLLELIPLAADHDAVPIPIRLRASDDRRDHARIKSADPLEQVSDLLLLLAQLGRVSNVLILAATAIPKVATGWFDAVGRN